MLLPKLDRQEIPRPRDRGNSYLSNSGSPSVRGQGPCLRLCRVVLACYTPTGGSHSLFLLAPFPRFPLFVFVLWFASSALAARFTSRNLLASSCLLCNDAINLSARNRTSAYHGTPTSLRAASVQTSLSTPKVRRSVDVEPCRAPNALKSSLKLFYKCCAGWPGPVSSPFRVARRAIAASGVSCLPVWPSPPRTGAVAGELPRPHFGSWFS